MVYIKTGRFTLKRVDEETQTNLESHRQEQLVPYWQIVGIRHASLVKGHVEVAPSPAAAADVVEVWLAEVRPERAVFVAVDGEVDYSVIFIIEARALEDWKLEFMV